MVIRLFQYIGDSAGYITEYKSFQFQSNKYGKALLRLLIASS